MLITYIACPLNAMDSSYDEESKRIREKFAGFNGVVVKTMQESMEKSAREKNDYDILEETILKISPIEYFPNFTLPQDEFEKHVVNIFYPNKNMQIFEPTTEPHGGASLVKVFKYQTETVAALKIYDPSESGDESENIAELFKDPIFECFSTLYVKSFLDQFTSNHFKFSALNCAGLNTNPEENNKKSFFLLFEGASGNSFSDLCIADLILSDNGIFIGYLTDIAKAFADLHQLTRKEHQAFEKIKSLNESYDRILTNLKQHLVDEDTEFKEESFAGGEILFRQIQAFKERMEDKDSNVQTAYLPDLSMIHEDAHIGNIFYDAQAKSQRVTFIDYETALRSFRQNGDPLKDIGFFLGSLWQKVALIRDEISNISNEALYAKAKDLKIFFIESYLSETHQVDQIKQASERITLHMWSRVCYSGELNDYSSNVINCIQFFGKCDLAH